MTWKKFGRLRLGGWRSGSAQTLGPTLAAGPAALAWVWDGDERVGLLLHGIVWTANRDPALPVSEVRLLGSPSFPFFLFHSPGTPDALGAPGTRAQG
jgi:hypothetical protein